MIPLALTGVAAKNGDYIHVGYDDVIDRVEISPTDKDNIYDAYAIYDTDNGKAGKLTDLKDHIHCEDSCYIEYPITDQMLSSGHKINMNYYLTTNNGKEYYQSYHYIYKTDANIQLNKAHPSLINIYGKNMISIIYDVDGIDNDLLGQLEIVCKVNDKEYEPVITGNRLTYNIPVTTIKGDYVYYEIYTKNTNLDFYEDDTIDIINEQELTRFRFTNMFIQVRKGEAQSISLEKYPYSYECDIETHCGDDEMITIEQGRVIGLKEGSTFISAYCNGRKAKAIVQVLPEKVELSFTNTKNYIEVDKTEPIAITTTPSVENFNRRDISWYTDDFLIAGVDDEGNITGYNKGSVILSLYYDGNEYETTYDVLEKVQEIETTQEEIVMTEGETIALAAKTLPDDITYYEDIDYEISGDDCIIYNGTNVIAVDDGVAYIRFYHDDVEKVVEVTVNKRDEDLNDFALAGSSFEMSIGDTFDFSKVFISSGASYEDLYFESNDTKVCIVDTLGNVTPVSKGSTLITIRSKTTVQYFEIIVE